MYDKLKNIISEAVRDAMNEVRPMWMTGYHRLTEAKLNRIMKHGDSGMVIISANRSGVHSDNSNSDLTAEYAEWLDKNGMDNTEENEGIFLKERNKDANRKLIGRIKASGLSYTPVYGGYHGRDSVQDDFESSYIVYAKDRSGGTVDFETLFDFAKDWCGRFKQDSVYVQPPFEAPMYIDCNGNRVDKSSSKNFIFNRDNEEFCTTTKCKHTEPQRFTADINFESFYHKGVSSYVDRMRRSKGGEFIL